MSSSKKLSQSIDFSSKSTALNPNAAEFVPFSLRSPGSTSNSADAAPTSRITTSGAALHRSESSVSNASDDEAHRFWRHQLPDDITPDFKITGEDESHGYGDISFAGLSLNDGGEASRFSTFAGSGYGFNAQREVSPRQGNGSSFSDKMRLAASSYVEDSNAGCLLHSPTKPWDKQFVNTDQLLGNGREMNTSYSENSRQKFVNDILSEQALMDGSEMNPLEFLASQFPGFAAESLAEVYYANGCDLNLTIEMLIQLELQVDAGLSQSTTSKTLSPPNLDAMDFPALSMQESQNATSKYAIDDVQQSTNSYQSPEKENMLLFKSGASFFSRGATDFASAVRKMALQDSSVWKCERNGPADSTVGSSRSSNVLASAYSSGQGRGMYADRVLNRSSSRAAPTWLETGEAVGHLYSEMREEARDHARLRNAYFEQARQAYLIGNKALAKELSGKGQLHNVQMKAAHGKAQDSIYRQRNQGGVETYGNGRGNERMIDLHGLHVSEALHVLRQELGVLRSTARAVDQRLQVYICVGTGHHTRGTRTPARLPVAVQRYLLEEEGLEYSETQPGLLRVVIY